jgi:Na+-dependent transporters of the SNF family
LCYEKEKNFGSRTAVIMAMAGSAIGLGNIWRFPYIVGEYGGAAFILVFLVCCIFVSLPILLSEAIIGRRTHHNTFGAMETLAPDTKWKWIGLLTVVTPLIILSYYSVVGGWSVEYLVKSAAGQFSPDRAEEVTGMFGEFVSSTWTPLLCHFVFLALCAVIVYKGVKNGIEMFSKATMPILFLLVALIAVYSMTLPGSVDGVRYLVKPDFSKLTPSAFASALGQSFFSLSLGVGTMLTYSSYVSKDENIVASGVGTAFSDLFFAVLAGFRCHAGCLCRGHHSFGRAWSGLRDSSLHLRKDGCGKSCHQCGSGCSFLRNNPRSGFVFSYFHDGSCGCLPC